MQLLTAAYDDDAYELCVTKRFPDMIDKTSTCSKFNISG